MYVLCMLNDIATSAIALPVSADRRWRGDRREVRVDLDILQVISESPDSGSGDQLTIVQFYAL